MMTGIRSWLPIQAAVAPVVAIASYVLLHWRGIGLSVDGWNLWQGAVSLMAGHGFTHFSGDPIVFWPPLYSAYLGLWILLVGPTGWGLLLANGVLIATQAALWLTLTIRIARDTGSAIQPFALLVLASFVGLFVATTQQSIYGSNLLYALLPAYLGGLWKIVSRPELETTLGDLLYASGLGTALLLTHSLSFVFVVTGCLLIFVARRRRAIPTLFVAFLILVVPVAIWWFARSVFEQHGSHPVGGFGAGRFSPLANALALLNGPGRLLFPDAMGAQYLGMLLLLATAIFLARAKSAVGLRFGLAFVLCSTTFLYLIFNVTWIWDPLWSYRYILFDPLLLVPLLFVTALPIAPRLATAVLLLLLIPQLYRTAGWAKRHHTMTLTELGYPKGFVSPSTFIDRAYPDGPREPTDGVPSQ